MTATSQQAATPIRAGNYVLGLQIGVASLGWTALTLDAEEKPVAVLAMGARKFPMGATGDIERGRETSRNERRREARSTRVRLARRAERLRRVWDLLVGAGFLPRAKFRNRDATIKALDADFGDRAPWMLRAKALDTRLTPYELGRAIYHIAHRRGFQSNRRGPANQNEEKELGVVKQGILSLEEAMASAQSRTLGEHLARLDNRTPLRRRWTAREMIRVELDAVLAKQREHHAALTAGYCTRLAAAILTQRPLKSQANRIGKCDLETNKRRAAVASLDAQEFRVLARVNDLRLVDDVGAEPVELTPAQRQTLLSLLKDGDATFASIRKAIKLPKTVRFNAERINDKTLIGLRTEGKMRSAIGAETWDAMPRERQSSLVGDILDIDDDAGLKRRLTDHWKLPAEAVERLLATQVEPGCAALSHKAICRLLPLLRQAVAYATARKQIYPNAGHHGEQHALLPMVQKTYKALANPLVARALSEMRVVVNALIKRYGLPAGIRVSLHRQLRVGRKAREKASFRMHAQHKIRAAAAERVLKEMGVQEPTRHMIDKVLLAEECAWTCPFTGKAISMRALVGGDPRFEVVHLVPLYQSLDDSFANKSLCHVSLQPEQKALRQKDSKAIARFEQFTGIHAKDKLRRVKMTDEEIKEYYSEQMVAGRFVDSCYASRLAVDYLAQLYPSTRTAVAAVRGAIVGYVREGCGLGRFDLPDGSYKVRAIEAAAVAMCDSTIVRRISTAAKAAPPGYRRLRPGIVLPWPRFTEDVRNAAHDIVVSARVRTKIRGPLHEETFYRRHAEDGKERFSVRKHLWQLTVQDLALIEGVHVRQAVMTKVAELGGGDPRKLFAQRDNLPTFQNTVVRRVRVMRNERCYPVGRPARYVSTERNHHAAVFLNDKGKTDRVIVNLFEAYKRKATKQPVVQYPTGVRALGTLAVGETIRLEGQLWTVRCVSLDPPVVLTPLDDGRTLAEITESNARLRASVEQLRKRGAEKIVIGPLGEIRRAGLHIGSAAAPAAAE